MESQDIIRYHTIHDRESYDDRKCDNDQESYRVPEKKSGPKKRFLAIFSCWMVLYGPKQCCMIRAYHCAALDTPLAYIRKKIDLRPPGPQAPGAVFWPPGRILARKSVFCYRTPDFVDGPFVTLEDIFDLAPSDRFLVAVRRLGGSFSGHRAGFLPENPFFSIGPRISSMARF